MTRHHRAALALGHGAAVARYEEAAGGPLLCGVCARGPASDVCPKCHGKKKAGVVCEDCADFFACDRCKKDVCASCMGDMATVCVCCHETACEDCAFGFRGRGPTVTCMGCFDQVCSECAYGGCAGKGPYCSCLGCYEQRCFVCAFKPDNVYHTCMSCYMMRCNNCVSGGAGTYDAGGDYKCPDCVGK